MKYFVFFIHVINYYYHSYCDEYRSKVSTKMIEHKINWSKIEPYLQEQQKLKEGLIDVCRTPKINNMQLDNIPDSSKWQGFDDILLNRAHRKLDKLKRINQMESGNGKGVVYVTSSTYFQITLAGLLTLRAKSDLPIEVFHHDELTEREIKTIERVSKTTVITLVKRRFNGVPIQFSGGFRNYHLKLAALLASSFQEILYLDDDNYLIQDPIMLFNSLEYLNTGLLLWKDVWKANPDNPVYDIFGVTCKEGFENESGQIVINKHIHYQTLVLGYEILQQHDYW
eukprot:NODE_770_length_4383_cov_0.310224.p1 type:complete len:283 gc:universal NODE_770_length_4383_cov_0.310224:2231-1383(-)